MRILFAGTPDVAVPSLEAIASSSNEVVGALTRPPARKGRRSALIPSPVADAARRLNIPLLETNQPGMIAQQIEALEPDLGVVVAYGAILRPEILQIPVHGWINLHFSALPRWRGAAPVQHTIWNRDSTASTSVFQLEEGLDTGPIYTTQTIQLDGHETTGSLLADLAQRGASQLVETISLIANGASPVPQATEGETYAGRIKREDAFVDFRGDARATDAHIRAMTPSPGAWTAFKGAPMKLTSASVLDVDAPSGEVLLVDGQVAVGCEAGSVVLSQVAPAGKRWMDALSWWNGQRGEDIKLGDK